MAMDREEMRDEVITIIGGRTDLDSQINTRLDWAYDIIANMYPWDDITEAEDTTTVLVPGTKDYSRPTALSTVELVRTVSDSDGTGESIDYQDYVDFSDKHPYQEGQAKGRPQEWTRTDGKVRVDPIPGTSQTSVVVGTDANNYYCILSHTSEAANAPITGGSYATYWALYTGSETASTWATGTSYRAEKLYMTGVGKVTLFAAAGTPDDAVSSLNRRLDEAIVYLTASKCFATIQEINGDAQYWKQQAIEIVDEVFGAETALNEG